MRSRKRDQFRLNSEVLDLEKQIYEEEETFRVKLQYAEVNNKVGPSLIMLKINKDDNTHKNEALKRWDKRKIDTCRVQKLINRTLICKSIQNCLSNVKVLLIKHIFLDH